jgi:uncharacterized protein with PIN domain
MKKEVKKEYLSEAVETIIDSSKKLIKTNRTYYGSVIRAAAVKINNHSHKTILTKDVVDIKQSESGSGCPNCGKECIAQHTLKFQSKAEFIEAPDPHYKWKEIHQCNDCETYYWFENGTQL